VSENKRWKSNWRKSSKNCPGSRHKSSNLKISQVYFYY